MRYTIWSRGRLIGATDLAFTCPMETCRGGWFHPNADGARLMPVISSILPALQAYLGRDVPPAGDRLPASEAPPLPELPELPELPGPASLADLREAFHHVASLDLELRDRQGAVIPTSSIGIQDLHVLRELAREVMSGRGLARYLSLDDDPAAAGPECTIGTDAGDTAGGVGAGWRDADDGVDQCWFDAADGGCGGGRDREERYQVFLVLADGPPRDHG